MQVKIFESTDMASGLKLVKETLGPDALILSTRTVHNGRMGILGKPVLEITAAVDSPAPPFSQTTHQSVPPRSHTAKKAFSRWTDDDTPPSRVINSTALTYDASLQVRRAEECGSPVPTTGSIYAANREELAELKEMVKKLGQDMARLGACKSSTQPFTMTSDPAENTSAAAIHACLRAQGINTTTIAELSRRTQERIQQGISSSPPQEWYPCLRETIRESIAISNRVFSPPAKQRRIALVGPTGVGKTTTLAKIAAHYLGNISNSIALITIDTYRIAAIEQLKVYGSIMSLPVEVVINPDQLKQALARHQDKEFILIDTAGRSPHDTLSISELAGFFRADLDIDKHLVISATTRDQEIRTSIERFGVLGIDSAIITKTDECTNLGMILNIQMHNPEVSLPFSCLTNGQRVPEDLLNASAQLITDMILPPLAGATSSTSNDRP